MIHIVDDNPQIRAATSYLLAAHGYRTEIYGSGEELLAQPRLRDGCILCDWEMPELSALKCLAELEARGCPNPVIMVGAETSVSAAIGSLRRGAFDFLQKPYDEAELIATIERALDRSREDLAQGKRKTSARSRIGRLSARKREILQGLLAGMSNKMIAQRLADADQRRRLHQDGRDVVARLDHLERAGRQRVAKGWRGQFGHARSASR